MRDVVNRIQFGSFNFKQVHSDNPAYNRDNDTQTAPGRTLRGRSDSIPSNGLTATAYHAYDIRIGGGQWNMSQKKYYPGGVTLSKAYNGQRTHPQLQIALEYIAPFSYKPTPPAWMGNMVRNDLLAKASELDWNAANTIGEMRTTLQMVASAVSTGLRAAHQARKGNWGKAWSTMAGKGSKADRVANAHLAVTYGWKPLISDIQNALNAFDKGMRDPALVKVTATNVKTSSTNWRDSRYIRTGSATYGWQGGLTFKVIEPTLATYASYGVLNPFLVAWELVPLSFVIDWFLSVGSYLQGLGATMGLQFAAGYLTSFSRESGSVTDTKYPLARYEGNSPSWDFTAFAMNRTPFFTWPRPIITIRLGLNLNQLASAMALVQQRT